MYEKMYPAIISGIFLIIAAILNLYYSNKATKKQNEIQLELSKINKSMAENRKQKLIDFINELYDMLNAFLFGIMDASKDPNNPTKVQLFQEKIFELLANDVNKKYILSTCSDKTIYFIDRIKNMYDELIELSKKKHLSKVDEMKYELRIQNFIGLISIAISELRKELGVGENNAILIFKLMSFTSEEQYITINNIIKKEMEKYNSSSIC